MPLTSLVEGDLDKHVAENRASEGCWYFVHIPKTAGSSFGEELSELLSPNHKIHVDDDHRPLPYLDRLKDATRAFSERLKQEPLRFAAGHTTMIVLTSYVENWQALKLITMLRNPVNRVVSDYRYQTTPTHPDHGAFIERYPTLLSYAETTVERNKMYRFLRPFGRATVAECREFVIQHFAFVGIVEMYPLSFRLVTRLIGQERGPTRRLRKTADTEHNRVEITPELVERLRDLNSLDTELYEYFRRKLLPIPATGVRQPQCEFHTNKWHRTVTTMFAQTGQESW